jgi:hypothetical protein
MEPAMSLTLYLDLVLLSLLTVLLAGVSVHRAMRAQKRREKALKKIEQQIGAMRGTDRAAASHYA